MLPRLQDRVNLLAKLNWPKLANASKVLGSFYVSKLTKSGKINGMPISISIEPTTACNLGCPECPSGQKAFTRKTGQLNPELYKNIIDQLAPSLGYINFYFQGEPYINPRLLEMVSYASEKGIYTSTSTNAHFLHNENARKTVTSGLDRLIISIDGTTQKTYQAYRKKGKLEKVIEGTKNIIAWKKKLKKATPHVIFQFLVVRPNEHEVEEVLALAKQLGVGEVRFKTAQIYNYQNGDPLIPIQDKYSRYRRQADGSYKLKNKLVNQCWKMWHSCVITWDGNVVPCCFDKDAQHTMGDLGQQGFKALWTGESYTRFRKAILKSRSEIDICKNCSEGTKVWA